MISKRVEFEESGVGIDECCNVIMGKYFIFGDVFFFGFVGVVFLDVE